MSSIDGAVRQQSAWNNADLFKKVLQRIATALRPFQEEFQVVLIMDALVLHWNAACMKVLRQSGILPVCVPPLMTSVMQPLDTHVFSCFKKALCDAYDQKRSIEREDLDMAGFIACLQKAVREILVERSWCHAFDQNGWSLHQLLVGKNMSEIVRSTSVSVGKPGRDVLQQCLPRTLQRTVNNIEACFFNGAASCAPIAVASKRAAMHWARPHVDHNVIGRTRSETKRLRSAL